MPVYLQVEPYLTVSDFTKVEKDLDRISEKQTDIEERLRLLEKNRKQNNNSEQDELVLNSTKKA